MIRKQIKRINEWYKSSLRSLLGRLTLNNQIIIAITMVLVLSILSIYMTVFSIYNFGKGKGNKIHIEQIKDLELQLEKQRDSINNQNNNYKYGGTNQ